MRPHAVGEGRARRAFSSTGPLLFEAREDRGSAPPDGTAWLLGLEKGEGVGFTRLLHL